MKRVERASAVAINESAEDLKLVFDSSSKKNASAMFNGIITYDTSKFSSFFFFNYIEVLNESLRDSRKAPEYSKTRSMSIKQRRRVSVRELFGKK